MNYITLRMMFFASLSLLLLPLTSPLMAKAQLSTKKIDPQTHELMLEVAIHPDDFVDKKYITFSVDHPDVELSPWQSTSESTTLYDPTVKETKKIFNKNFTVSLRASQKNDASIPDAHLYFSYYLHSEKRVVQEILPLTCLNTAQETQPTIAVETSGNVTQAPTKHPVVKKETPADKASWSQKLSNLVENTDSTPIRILLVLLLGILMSLTPCIYPMIPITVGILQGQAGRSFFGNLLLALSYTFGIATTFALLGLTAAFTGQIFGSIMSSPLFILCVVAVLVYLGLSMLGFYDMYTPRFMTNHNQTKGGSYLSAFLFGAASGTIASPCLSPGLILLLSIVTALGNKLLGFILLFSFGVGLSLPLLIIGTFSTSLNMLPRAGMWMVEIKKLFGILLFAMCFYFLNNIMALQYLLWLMCIAMFAAGVFYLYSVTAYDTRLWRSIKNALGIGFIACSMVTAFHAYQAMHPQTQEGCAIAWEHNYEQAFARAKEENKLLFVDGGAPFCSICKAIDRTILSNAFVIDELKKFVTVKVDVSDTTPVIEELKNQYKIIGAPTIMIIDPSNGGLLRKWGPELYETPVESFISELQTY